MAEFDVSFTNLNNPEGFVKGEFKRKTREGD